MRAFASFGLKPRKPPFRRRRRSLLQRNRAWLLPLFVALLPFAVMGAYDPGALLAVNNLSDVATPSSAWANLGGGTAGKKAASNNSDGTVASVSGAYTIGHCLNAADTSGSVGDAGAACGGGWTVATYTSNTATLTLGSTTNDEELIAQGTPAALTIDLPTSPAVGLNTCIKDKANNFATNAATVKTTDGSTIDGTAGTTGYVMNQKYQENCFISDGTNWFVR